MQEQFENSFSLPDAFGEECEFLVVSRNKYKTKEETKEVFIQAWFDLCGYGTDDFSEEFSLDQVKPYFVYFYEGSEDLDDDDYGWRLNSQKEFPVWVHDPENIIRIK